MITRTAPRLLIALCLGLLLACTPRGQMRLVPPEAPPNPTETIFVATSRAIDPETARFGSKRSERPNYARYDVAIPRDRKVGTITYPRRGGKPDPSRDFLTTSEVVYPDDAAFRAALTSALRVERRGGREATIFVHGYNNTFSEGVYRIAQLAHDTELPGTALHFSWPSAATPFGYVHDRDSMVYSRNGLEAMLREVAASGADRIFLVAHSMGSALTVETLRQLAIRGDRATLDRIAGVILISPDIDVEVFRSQARDIGKLPKPFLIFGSRKDKALRLSAQLSGQADRLGSLSNLGAVADLDVIFLDVAAFNVGDGHFNVGKSAALIALLGRMIEVDAAFDGDQAIRPGLISGAVLTVQNATRIILAPVAAVGVGLQQ